MVGFDEAVSVTDAPDRCEAWRADFAASADWTERAAVQVPREQALREFCTSCRFPMVAVDHLVEQRATWDDPRIRRLGAHVQWLIGNRYTPAGYHRLGWAPVFSRCPLFYAYAALGLAREVAVDQAARGIDPEITRATLWDIGQQIYLHDRVHGRTGMNKGWWLSHHLSHHLYRLGRLQFQRGRAVRPVGPVAPGEPFLDVHIPEDGALEPAACDAAFASAAPFFARFFPAEEARYYICSSWLLDPVLVDMLPRGSNILTFQQRFQLHALRDGPSGVFEFVFDRPDLDAMEIPDLTGVAADTRLRQAILDHYRGGGVVRMGVGTIRL